MKKSILALSVISALFLSGCSSDDDEIITPEPTSRSVEVNLTIPQISATTNDEPATPWMTQIDSKGFQHALLLEQYYLCYSDDVVNDKCQDINLTDKTFKLDVTGSATFTVSHPSTDNNIYTTSPVYTASGTATLGVDATEILIPVENTKWQYISVEHSNDVNARDGIKINNHDASLTLVEQPNRKMEEQYQYSFGYVLIDSTVTVDTHKYGELSADTIYKAKEHIPLRLNFNENGGIVIGEPNFGEPLEPIAPIEPTLPVFDATIANSGGLDFATKQVDFTTGAVTYKIKDANKNFTPEAYTYTPMLVGTHQLKEFNFIFEASIDNGHTPVISIYVSDKKGATIFETTQLKFSGNYDAENSTPMVTAYSYIDGIWQAQGSEQSMSEFSDLYIPVVFGEDATMGNFYVRYSDSNASAGSLVTIKEYDFSLHSKLSFNNK